MLRIKALERLGQLLFPDSPELRMSGPSWMTAYADMRTRYTEYERYYSGRVFNELSDPKRNDSEPKYPLKINLTREWAHMLASYLWGQWTDSTVAFDVERNLFVDGDVPDIEDKRAASMEDILRRQWVLNENSSHSAEASIDNVVYGGSVIKTYWDNIQRRVRDEWLAPDIFMPRWHPTDVNQLLEAIVSFVIPRDDARDIFGLDQALWAKLPNEVIVWERWTNEKFILMVDKYQVRDSEVNPLGFIPHTYIPRVRSKAANYGYFGISTFEDTMSLQDEVNARAADIGDGVAYSSHPIRWIVNYTGVEQLEIGPDAIWDLGMGLGSREPKAGSLDVKTNYKEGMEFVERIERMGRGASHLPAVAFGEDEGSQRSGTTLLIRFLPLTQEIRSMRLNWATGLRRKAMNTLKLSEMHRDIVPGVRYEKEDLDDRIVVPRFAPILPKDVSEKVEEWTKRIAGGFGTPEEAYQDLGHPRPKAAAEDSLKYLEEVARQERIVKGVTNGTGTGSNAGGNSSAKADIQSNDKGSS